MVEGCGKNLSNEVVYYLTGTDITHINDFSLSKFNPEEDTLFCGAYSRRCETCVILAGLKW